MRSSAGLALEDGPHRKVYKGFISVLLEGHTSLLMNAGMCAWTHRWVILEPCEGAKSCCKVQGAPSKCSRAHGNSSPSKMSESPESTKPRGDLPLAVTAAQTITEVGFWRRLTLLPSTDAFLFQTRSFWWLAHCLTSNLFSSENTKLGSICIYIKSLVTVMLPPNAALAAEGLLKNVKRECKRECMVVRLQQFWNDLRKYLQLQRVSACWNYQIE